MHKSKMVHLHYSRIFEECVLTNLCRSAAMFKRNITPSIKLQYIFYLEWPAFVVHQFYHQAFELHFYKRFIEFINNRRYLNGCRLSPCTHKIKRWDIGSLTKICTSALEVILLHSKKVQFNYGRLTMSEYSANLCFLISKFFMEVTPSIKLQYIF
jgi:hypothetical protein